MERWLSMMTTMDLISVIDRQNVAITRLPLLQLGLMSVSKEPRHPLHFAAMGQTIVGEHGRMRNLLVNRSRLNRAQGLLILHAMGVWQMSGAELKGHCWSIVILIAKPVRAEANRQRLSHQPTHILHP